LVLRTGAKIIRTAMLQTRSGAPICASIVVKPNGNYCRLSVIRQASGIPERASRKLQLIGALNFVKLQKAVNLPEECPFEELL